VEETEVTRDELLNQLTVAAKLAELLRNKPIASRLAWLREKVKEERFYLVMVGETSSGKSTFLNSLLGQQVLYTAPVASTDHIAEIWQEAGREGVGVELVMEGSEERLSTTVDEYHRICQQEPGSIRRAIIRTPPVEGMPEHVFIDTPGYNSVLERHTEVLESFLPNADAVIFVFNFMKMPRPDDIKYIDLIKQRIGLDNVFFAVNHKRGRGRDKKSPRVIDLLRSEKGYTSERGLYELKQHKQDGHWAISSPGLMQDIRHSIDPEERRRVILRNAQGILDQQLEILKVEFLTLTNATKEKAQDNRRTMKKLEALRQFNAGAVEQTKGTFFERYEACLGGFRKELTEEISQELKTGYKNKAAVKLRLEQTIIPNQFELLNLDIQELLYGEVEALEERVHDRCKKTVRLLFEQSPNLKAGMPGYVEKAIRQGGEKAIISGLLSYFARYGGVAGHKGGFINLSKHLLSKGGKLFGKKFSRPVYDQMGKTLARLGLKSTRVAGAVALAVIEVFIIIIDAATWKKFARRKAGKALDKGIKTLSEDAKGEFGELFSSILSDLNDPVDGLYRQVRRASEGQVSQRELDQISALFESLEPETY